MASLHGEYPCSLDNKGRIKLPVGLKEQLAPDNNSKFMLKRGARKCLTLYPWNEWLEVSAQVDKLNTFVVKNAEYVRHFYFGATVITLDSTDRMLVPKQLLDYAGISKDAVLAPFGKVIEIWDEQTLMAEMNKGPEYYEQLGEEVMGNLKQEGQP